MIDRLEDEVELLDRHLSVLGLVIDREPIGIVTLADETDHSHSEIRYSLRTLEEEALIESSPEGAVTTEATTKDIDERVDELVDRLQSVTDGDRGTGGDSADRTTETKVYQSDDDPTDRTTETKVYRNDET
jgi:predicted transcriptional regulator